MKLPEKARLKEIYAEAREALQMFFMMLIIFFTVFFAALGIIHVFFFKSLSQLCGCY